MTTRIAALAAALLLGSLVAPPAAGATPTTLTFDAPTATATTGWSLPLATLDGYAFHNFRIMNGAEPFGTGTNASSGAQFAYAGYDAASVYRTDLAFSLLGAFLSFRSTDGDLSPLELVVRGYRAGPDPVFTRTLALTSDATHFAFDLVGVEEVVFDVADDARFAVLAVDDLTVSAVPEPGTVALVASGLLVVLGRGLARRRGRPSAAS